VRMLECALYPTIGSLEQPPPPPFLIWMVGSHQVTTTRALCSLHVTIKIKFKMVYRRQNLVSSCFGKRKCIDETHLTCSIPRFTEPATYLHLSRNYFFPSYISTQQLSENYMKTTDFLPHSFLAALTLDG